MRIAYISDSVIPSRWANAVHVVLMSSAFAENGHQVLLIGMQGKGAFFRARKILEAQFRIEKRLRLLLFPLMRARLFKPAYGFFAALLSIFFRPNLVVSRNISGAVVSTRLGYATALELHDLSFLDNLKKSKAFLRLLPENDLRIIICVSHALRAEIVRQFPDISSKVMVLHDGAISIPPIDSRPSDNHRPRVGYVGHLYPGKGAALLPRLAEIRPHYDFHVYGGNIDDVNEFRSRYSELPNLEIHGWVPHSEAQRAISGLDYLLLPNEERVFPGGGETDIGKWTSPLKLFEYMAAGKPIVSSDIPVLREVLEHGRNALLCAPMAVDQWVGALDSLVNNPALAAELGKRAKADFERHYSWATRAQKLIEAVSCAGLD